MLARYRGLAAQRGETLMQMRAAVLEEFGRPLAVQEVELADPKAGEVLVRLVACGACHTDLYTASGADPSGYAPAVLGHEGAGVVEAVGEGVSSVSPGDHAEQGLPARRHGAALARRRADPPLHGHEHARGVHGDAGDRAGQGLAGRAARARVPVRLRALDGARRGDVHGQGRGRVDLHSVGSRHGGTRSCRGLPPPGRRADHLRRPVRGPARARRGQGATDTWIAGEDTVQRYLDGDIDVAPFVSHRITLDDVNHGFELMEAQDGIRSVIDF
jgi:hypothetical protein